jgi:hypothetical protein
MVTWSVLDQQGVGLQVECGCGIHPRREHWDIAQRELHHYQASAVPVKIGLASAIQNELLRRWPGVVEGAQMSAWQVLSHEARTWAGHIGDIPNPGEDGWRL